MTVPRIDGLRGENWQNLSIQERLGELQKMETSLAALENRTPCKVDFIPDEAYKQPQDHQLFQGYHQDKGVFINENLITSDKPYNAVETLFHESRHDQQEHLAGLPETAQDSQQLQDFRMNTSGGYLDDKVDGYDKYRWQPIEKDANEVARQRTDELYANEFGDKSTYPEHRQQMEQNLSDDMFQAHEHLGDDYIEQARASMVEQFNQSQSVNQQTGLSDTYPQGEVQDTPSSGIRPDPTSQNADESAAKSVDEMAGKAVEEPAGLTSGKAAGEVPGDIQDVAYQPAVSTAKTTGEDLSEGTSDTSEKAAESAGEITGEAAGVSGGAEVGKAAGEAASETKGAVDESVGQSMEAPSGNTTSNIPENNDDIAQKTGEVAGEATGVPGGAEVGKAAGEAASETKGAVDESVGQSTEAPSNAIDEAANKAPASEANQPDNEQYQGYGY